MEGSAIDEMFATLGPVTVRRMFGGKGIYHQGRILAIEVRGEMLLKADALSAPDFAAVGATQWRYDGREGRPVLMPYWTVPDDAFDDPDIMAHWVRLAFAAAGRAAPSRARRDGTTRDADG